jgi:hypothetical protein
MHVLRCDPTASKILSRFVRTIHIAACQMIILPSSQSVPRSERVIRRHGIHELQQQRQDTDMNQAGYRRWPLLLPETRRVMLESDGEGDRKRTSPTSKCVTRALLLVALHVEDAHALVTPRALLMSLRQLLP